MNNKSSFLNNCYEWLFNEEEKRPIAYIAVFSTVVIISVVISIFIVTIDRYVGGIILWMFN